MPAKAQSNIVIRLFSIIRRDPQKAGILTVLVAILVVLQIRLRNSMSSGAQMATAAVSVKSNKPGTSGSAQPHSNAPAKPLDAASAFKAFMEAPITPVKRDLFAIDLERFPQESGHAASGNGAAAGFWDELAKSMSARADVKRERQILIENVQQQASQLRLQSTMMGATPKAVIDGDLVGEGDVVAAKSGESRVSFRVLKIEARRIIVEREGIKLVIQMN